MMDSAVEKLNKAKRGLLLPSEYNKSLKPFDRYSSNHIISPLVHIFLALLFWVMTVVGALMSHIWSTYQALRMAAFFLFTFWRVDMVSAEQPGGRTPHREFSSSRVFSMQDVKLCQQAFSGPRPGYAVAGVPKDQRRNVRSKVGHVTLNDVICAVMADVLAGVAESKPKPTTLLGRAKRAVNKVLPNPMGVFMYVSSTVDPSVFIHTGGLSRPISLRQPGDWSMRNLSTAANVYFKPSRNTGPDVTIRQIHEHIHRCRHELSLFKHSNWPKFCFHVVQLTGQIPALFPLSWFMQSQEWNPLGKLVRWGVLKPIVDVALESCE